MEELIRSSAKQTIITERAPKAIGPYSQGVKAGGLVFTSGQIPIDPKTGELIQGSIKEEARQSLENVKAVIEAAGFSLRDVVKVTIYLTDMTEFGVVNEIYATYFGQDRPARSTVGVASLPKGARIEIEALAVHI